MAWAFTQHRQESSVATNELKPFYFERSKRAEDLPVFFIKVETEILYYSAKLIFLNFKF